MPHIRAELENSTGSDLHLNLLGICFFLKIWQLTFKAKQNPIPVP